MDIIKFGCYLLKMPTSRYELFESCYKSEDSFAEPVVEFDWSRNLPIICFVINQQNEVTYIGKGRKGFRAGTDLRRLNISEIAKLEKPLSITKLTEEIPSRFKTSVSARTKAGGLLPLKTSENFVDTILKLYPGTHDLLAKFGRTYRIRLGNLKEGVREALAQQKEAIATALSIAGMARDPLQEWYLKNDEQPKSFLDGIPKAYLREDQTIINDLHNFPGYEFFKSTEYSSSHFTNDQGGNLTIILANRLKLEEQTGTDLIYYNEAFKCFVMVQYKMMESSNQQTFFRFPNKQLDEELSRMDSLLQELIKCEPDQHHDGFRFNSNPFFLKICPRIVFNPSDKGLSKGMYIHHEHWKMLEKDPKLTGPNGGKIITYENIRRYLDNTSFINLVSTAWIGTTINQSTVLELVIRESIESGKAVVFAVSDGVGRSF